MSERSSPKPRNCPVCRKPAADTFKPFCSKRCADVDLSRWLNESYAIAAVEAPDSNDLPNGETENEG